MKNSICGLLQTTDFQVWIWIVNLCNRSKAPVCLPVMPRSCVIFLRLIQFNLNVTKKGWFRGQIIDCQSRAQPAKVLEQFGAQCDISDRVLENNTEGLAEKCQKRIRAVTHELSLDRQLQCVQHWELWNEQEKEPRVSTQCSISMCKCIKNNQYNAESWGSFTSTPTWAVDYNGAASDTGAPWSYIGTKSFALQVHEVFSGKIKILIHFANSFE